MNVDLLVRYRAIRSIRVYAGIHRYNQRVVANNQRASNQRWGGGGGGGELVAAYTSVHPVHPVYTCVYPVYTCVHPVYTLCIPVYEY